MSKFFSRTVNGVLVLDKPQGISSNRALQLVRKLFRAKKAGHTGSLDPLATGVLPLCFGEATKFSKYLLESEKAYLVKACLGVTTDSGDRDGQVTNEIDLPELTSDRISSVLYGFQGQYDQIPPMYSALKKDGVPLYRLARQGVEVERSPRRVTIQHIELLELSLPYFTFHVHVSKGTYVRSLVEDVGEKLGVGGHVVELRRTSAGGFGLDNALTMEQLEHVASEEGYHGLESLLESPGCLVSDWPAACISQSAADRLALGQTVETLKPAEEGPVKIYCDLHRFLGVGQVLSDGRLAPKRLVVQ